MARLDEPPMVGRRRHRRPRLRVAAVLVIVGALGLAWVATRPSTSKFCTAAASIDDVGAPTPAASRARWAAELELDIDVDHPDRTGGSGDRVTATYVLDGPSHGPTDPDRTYVREVVTERGGDDVWRVTSANTCEEWTSG